MSFHEFTRNRYNCPRSPGSGAGTSRCVSKGNELLLKLRGGGLLIAADWADSGSRSGCHGVGGFIRRADGGPPVGSCWARECLQGAWRKEEKAGGEVPGCVRMSVHVGDHIPWDCALKYVGSIVIVAV